MGTLPSSGSAKNGQEKPNPTGLENHVDFSDLPPEQVERMKNAFSAMAQVRMEGVRAAKASGVKSEEELSVFLRKYDRENPQRLRELLTKVVTDSLPATHPSDPENKKEEHALKRASVRTALERWEGPNGSTDIISFYEETIAVHAIKDPAAKALAIENLNGKMNGALGAGFDKTEISIISEAALSNRELVSRYFAAQKFAALAQHKDGSGWKEAQNILANNDLTEEQKAVDLDRVFRASAQSGNAELALIITKEDAILSQIQTIDLLQSQERERLALREKIGNQLVVQKARFSLEHIESPGLKALETLMNNGGGDIAHALLTGTVENIPSGVTGNIEGERLTVSLMNGELDCALIHDNQRVPLNGNLNTASFNEARLTGIANAIHSEYLQEPSETRGKIWKALFERHEGEYFMTAGEADFTQRVLASLLEGSSSKQEEIVTLKRLRFLTTDGKPNDKFLSWWTMELHYLTQDMSPAQFPSMIRPQILYPLAEKWMQEKKLSLQSYAELAHLPSAASPKEISPDVGMNA